MTDGRAPSTSRRKKDSIGSATSSSVSNCVQQTSMRSGLTKLSALIGVPVQWKRDRLL